VLVVVPQVPDCSPVAISSIPPFDVYVLAISLPYAAISVQIVPDAGVISV
jgi:hypothetical protein